MKILCMNTFYVCIPLFNDGNSRVGIWCETWTDYFLIIWFKLYFGNLKILEIRFIRFISATSDIFQLRSRKNPRSKTLFVYRFILWKLWLYILEKLNYVFGKCAPDLSKICILNVYVNLKYEIANLVWHNDA